MSSPEVPLSGDRMLIAIDDELVALHERYHHRRPVTARTQLLQDEILACVMGGVYSDVEKTMIELEGSARVIEVRGAFQHAMQHRFIEVVERLSGRTVETFISTNSIRPDLEVELFTLRAPPHPS